MSLKSSQTTHAVELPEGGLFAGTRYTLTVPSGLRLFSSDGGAVVLDKENKDGTVDVHVLGAPVTQLVVAITKRQGPASHSARKKNQGDARKKAKAGDGS